MNSTAGFAEDWEGNSLAMRYDETMSAAQQRYRDDIRRVERERKEVTEQQKQDLQTLRTDLQSSKDKLEQSKTRNTVLTNELKTLREQLKTSLDKSKHDDELIEVLLKQQQQMKTTHDQQQKDIDMKSKFSAELEQTYKLDQMKQSNLVKQLQLIVDQKEMKIRELEMHLDENRIEVSIDRRVISNVNYSFQYERDDPHASATVGDSLSMVNITSRHAPMQSVTLAPMQLATLKQTSSTTDPVLSRLEKNGFATSSSSRPASAVPAKRSSVSENKSRT